MKGKLPLAVIACTTAECTRAVPSQYWILFSLKIHAYRKPGLSWSRRCVSSPARVLKRKDRHKTSKDVEAREGPPYSALNLCRNRRTQGTLVQGFRASHVKKRSLTERAVAFCNTLTSPLTQKPASAIRPACNLQPYAVLPLQKTVGAGEDRRMTVPAQNSESLGSQLGLLKLPYQRPVPKAILGYMAKTLHWNESWIGKTCVSPHLGYSTSTSWSTVLSKMRLEDLTRPEQLIIPQISLHMEIRAQKSGHESRRHQLT